MPSDYGIRLCKLDECSEFVPPSKNPGVVRLFCCLPHSARYHQRESRRRDKGEGVEGALGVQHGKPYVRRLIARTLEAAVGRLKKHDTTCVLSPDGICPSSNDHFDTKRRCLIHAVLREDATQLDRASKGVVWEREVTSETGFWLSDMPGVGNSLLAIKEAQRQADREKQIAEFTAAGGTNGS